MNKYNLLFCIVLLTSCQYFQPKEVLNERVLAKVGDQSLTETDIAGLLPSNSSEQDSIAYVQKFVDGWVKKQLMIDKAKELIDFNEAEIANKVLDYQYALMVHELEKKHIEANLNTEVSEDEISDYYQLKSENFILRKNLAKVIYYQIPLKAPGLARFKRWVKSYPKDSLQIMEFGQQHATKSFTEVSEWVSFDEILMETPLGDITDKKGFLKRNSFIDLSDEEHAYIVKVLAFKLIGETAPLPYIREQIRDVIINKKKIELKKALEREIYEEAEQSNAFTIFTDL